LSAWWALMVLMLLSLYTIADRPLINLLVEPLRKELAFSDFQIGMVQGVSVALFTAFVGYPIAWLADRYDRRIVLAVSIGVWSVSLALVGLSRSFEEMFIASAFGGAGEAGLVPIALALIPELFRGQQRHLANSFMLLTGRMGAGLVVAMCGWLIVAVDSWRGLLARPAAAPFELAPVLAGGGVARASSGAVDPDDAAPSRPIGLALCRRA
jgi:MFS family permease